MTALRLSTSLSQGDNITLDLCLAHEEDESPGSTVLASSSSRPFARLVLLASTAHAGHFSRVFHGHLYMPQCPHRTHRQGNHETAIPVVLKVPYPLLSLLYSPCIAPSPSPIWSAPAQSAADWHLDLQRSYLTEREAYERLQQVSRIEGSQRRRCSQGSLPEWLGIVVFQEGNPATALLDQRLPPKELIDARGGPTQGLCCHLLGELGESIPQLRARLVRLLERLVPLVESSPSTLPRSPPPANGPSINGADCELPQARLANGTGSNVPHNRPHLVTSTLSATVAADLADDDELPSIQSMRACRRIFDALSMPLPWEIIDLHIEALASSARIHAAGILQSDLRVPKLCLQRKTTPVEGLSTSGPPRRHRSASMPAVPDDKLCQGSRWRLTPIDFSHALLHPHIPREMVDLGPCNDGNTQETPAAESFFGSFSPMTTPTTPSLLHPSPLSSVPSQSVSSAATSDIDGEPDDRLTSFVALHSWSQGCEDELLLVRGGMWLLSNRLEEAWSSMIKAVDRGELVMSESSSWQWLIDQFGYHVQ